MEHLVTLILIGLVPGSVIGIVLAIAWRIVLAERDAVRRFNKNN